MAERYSQAETDPTRSTLELLYHISRELASDLDLRTVLHRVLLLSLDSLGAITGSIILVDAAGAPVDSAIIHSGRPVKHTTTQLSDPLEKGLAGWVAGHRTTAIIDDTSRDERWLKRPDDAPDQTGPKSAMSTPLLAREELVGIMTLVHPRPGTFTAEHGDLLRAIADLAGIAILNARLFEESRRQARVMTALAESAMAITASLGTQDTLQRVLSQVQKALDAEAVSLALVDPDRRTLRLRAATGLPGPAPDLRCTLGRGICGQVAQTGQTQILPDLSAVSQFDPAVDALPGITPRAIACAPILAEGEILGTLEAFNPAGGFDPSAGLVLGGIGSLAGSVIRSELLFERLQAALASYRQLFEDSIDLILTTDRQGRIRQFNRQAAAAVQLTDKDLPGASIFDLVGFGPDRTAVVQLAARETVSFEAELSNAGGPMPVQVYVRPIRIENEDLLQWILHDLTARKALDAQRNELLAMIYHDLRSPLANVIYSIDMLETTLPETGETVASLLDIAHRATDRIQRLTSSLLDIQNLEAGQPVTNRTPVKAAELIQEALNAVRPLADARRQQLISRVETEPGTLVVDRDMLTRVLINLAENAVKYTPQGGRVEIGARQRDEAVEIWVADNGPGIPPEHHQEIFNKYTRLDKRPIGYGLGLSFCRLAVNAHGGEIRIEENEGPGSCFVVSLPGGHS